MRRWAGGYVTLGSTGESPERQQAVLSTLMEHTPAGLILSPAEGSDHAAAAGAGCQCQRAAVQPRA